MSVDLIGGRAADSDVAVASPGVGQGGVPSSPAADAAKQIGGSSGRYVFVIERQVGGVWRRIKSTTEDTAAAVLAEALVRQSPNEGVRILMASQVGGATSSALMIWEYEGRLLLPRPNAPAGSVARAGDDILARDRLAGAQRLSATSGGVQSSGGQSGGAEPVRLTAFNLLGAAPHAALGKRERSNVLRLMIMAIGIVVVFLAATSFLRNADPDSPTRARPSTSSRSVPAAPVPVPFPREVAYADLKYKQLAVARYYGYQTCIADALAAGVKVIRHSFQVGRISATLATLYENQYRDVLSTLEIARKEIVRHGNHEGGLPSAMLDFIDEWFRLNRDILLKSGRYADVVNPEEFCKAEAKRSAYLKAYYAKRDAPATRR